MGIQGSLEGWPEPGTPETPLTPQKRELRGSVPESTCAPPGRTSAGRVPAGL